MYGGTSLIRSLLPLGPYSRTMPGVQGGIAVSYERGSPVLHENRRSCKARVRICLGKATLRTRHTLEPLAWQWSHCQCHSRAWCCSASLQLV